MNENTTNNTKPDDTGTEQEKYCGRHYMNRNGHARWTGGVILIAIGTLLLLQNLGTIAFTRTWALLLMIPAIAAFSNAWKEYKSAGKVFSARTLSSLLGGLVLTTVTIVLLFNLRWEIFGPVILLFVGLGVLLRNTGRKAP